jgi:phospholipid/cholesterol/gamma-HCH transport system substrate-binding protein
MQKQAPTLGRILVAVGFALSCFGLILFLWVAFGGPVPLKPESYRITAYFPEATQLAQQSDVRIGGVSVGKVESIKLAPSNERVNGKDTTEAVIEIDPQYAPIASDAKAILRQKTLLGETYVELTSGSSPNGNTRPVALGPSAQLADAAASDSQSVHAIPEGGTLGVSQTQEATQIDEIFNALDKRTRTAFQRWLQGAQVAIQGRSVDLNSALGNLGPFAADASRVLRILHTQQHSVQGLVRDTGTVFSALSSQDSELAGAIRGSDTTFKALASESQSLKRTFEILPTFEHESKATLARLDAFRQNAHPLVRKLLPVATDVSPTLRSVRRLSPHLRSLFVGLRPLIKASKQGLPAAARFLNGVRPVLSALDPFLANVNPVVRFLKTYRTDVTNFLSNPGTGFGVAPNQPGQEAPRYMLRILSYFSPETLSIWPTRLPTNRGNAYFNPSAPSKAASTGFYGQGAAAKGIFPNWDCKNLDFTPPAGGNPDEDPLLPGQRKSDVNNGNPPSESFAPCFIQGQQKNFGSSRFPRVYAGR